MKLATLPTPETTYPANIDTTEDLTKVELCPLLSQDSDCSP